MDSFNILDSEEFLNRLLQRGLTATSSRLEDVDAWLEKEFTH